MNNVIAKLTNVKKTYSLGKVKLEALKGITKEIKEGFSIIYGPSACGKTTLLNLIGCIDKTTEGKIEILGKDITNLSTGKLTKIRRDYFGYVFQSFSLIPILTVYENIEYPIMKSKMKRQDRRDLIMGLLKETGIEGSHKRKPKELSGGQQQRVAIARALVSNPKIVIADEPTANLDSKTSSNIMDLLWRVYEKHNTNFIISSHDTELIKNIPNKIYIKDGNIAEDKEKI